MTSTLRLRPMARAFYARPALEVARDLIGCQLVHELRGARLVGTIVECEAYGADDPGSHAARGKTQRNAPMFETPGIAYVYFTYGMHWCLNVVTDTDGRAGAVLIRAIEPVEGLARIRKNRPGISRDRDLARGPGRLTQAFGISGAHNRVDLTRPPLYISPGERYPHEALSTTPRIGLGAKQDGRQWRFAVKGSPWVSRGSTAPSRPRARRYGST